MMYKLIKGDQMTWSNELILKTKEEYGEGKKFPGVNLALFNAYIDSFGVLDMDERHIPNVVNFLSEKTFRRKEKYATKLIKGYWKSHQKKTHYAFFMDELMKTELGIKIFNDYQRDHVMHSAYVFLLGIFIFMEDNAIKESIESFNQSIRPYTYYINSEMFIFMWNIISTFHDIGYPFESFSREMNSYLDKMDKFGVEVENYKVNSFEIIFKDLQRLSNGMNSFNYMNQMQCKHDKHNRFLNLEKYFNFQLKKGKIDHGIISSLFF